jgi:predicted secreted protein
MKHISGLAMSLILFSAGAQAGQKSVIEPIGFSKDGKSFAYIDSFQEMDGSDGASVKISFINLKTNQFALPSIKVAVSRESDQRTPNLFMTLKLQALAKASPSLKALGIVDRSAIEAFILGSTQRANVKEYDINTNGITSGANPLRTFGFRVETLPSGGRDFHGDLTQMLRLSVQRGYSPSVSAAFQVVQADASLPASRKNARDYALRTVYTNAFQTNNNTFEPAGMVAIVDVISTGHEGIDSSTIAVSVPSLATQQ